MLSSRRHLPLMLALVTLLGLMTLAPNASAFDDEPAALACSDGFDFDGTSCRRVDEPVTLALCPPGFTAESNGCVRIAAAVPLPDSCPENALGLPGRCYFLVARVAPEDDTPRCAEGQPLIDGMCEARLSYVSPDPIPVGTCPDFAPATAQIIDGLCINITRYSPFVRPALCPQDSLDTGPDECRRFANTVIDQVGCSDPLGVLEGDVCVTRTDFAAFGICVPGAVPDDAATGLCAQTAEAQIAPSVCPEDAIGLPGACYRVVQNFVCFDGVLSGDRCVLTLNGPIETQAGLTCAFGAVLIDSRCIRTQRPAVAPGCPAGSDLVNSECRITVDDVAQSATCDSASVLANGLCFAVGAATSACPVGSSAAENQCVSLDPAARSSVAAAEPYPGPFTNMPAGPAAGLLDAPDIAFVDPGPPTLVAASADIPTQQTQLAHTGAETDMVNVGLSSLAIGFGLLGASRKRRRAQHH